MKNLQECFIIINSLWLMKQPVLEFITCT